MIKFCFLLCLILLLLMNYIIVIFADVKMPKRYHFNNDILFEPIRSLGLRVSIPNIAKNIKRFSFHGNIDDEIDVADNGTLNKSCFEEINGRWTIIFDNNLLYKNDIIYYWFEVQINDDIYRYSNRNFTVTDLIFLSTSKISPFTTDCHNSTEISTKKPIQNLYSTDSHDNNNFETSFMQRFESVSKDVDFLKKLFHEHINKPANTQLILIDTQPPSTASQTYNPNDNIQKFLIDQLQYYSELDKFHQPNNTKCGIVFDMIADINIKIILFKALDILNNTNYKLIDNENYYCNDSSGIKSSPILTKPIIMNSTERYEPLQIYFPLN